MPLQDKFFFLLAPIPFLCILCRIRLLFICFKRAHIDILDFMVQMIEELSQILYYNVYYSCFCVIFNQKKQQ